jgi:hypothetical protein
MSRINRIIPFSWWPANWGTSGTQRDEARANYEWDGEDLERKLLEIRHPMKDSMAYRLASLQLDYRYHRIGEYEYGLGMIANDPQLSSLERQRETARYLNRFGKITREELEFQLFELDHEVKSSPAYQRDLLTMEVKWGKKTAEEADQALLLLDHPNKESKEHKIAQAELDWKHAKITENQRDKTIATLNGEPWWCLVGADKKITGDNVQMAVELDWNDHFIEYLESKGWTGRTPDEVMDRWFDSAMRQMLEVDEDGYPLDDGSADPMPLATVNRGREDGLAEYS